jgi:hypothetical protein
MKFARNTAIALLAFLALTAFAGSVPMMLHPYGNATLPLSTLENSPFRTYLIPGVLLFTANGVLAIAVFWLVLRRSSHHAMLTAFQGSVLLVWLIAECWLLRAVVWLHYFYAAIAVALIICGLLMRREGNFSRGDRPPGTLSA